MKAATVNRTPYLSRPILPLPNVRTRRAHFRKLLDSVLVVASGAGLGVAMLFLLTLS